MVPQARKYWIAVVGQTQDEESFLSQGWWCLQSSAQVGDFVLAYRTQRADAINAGVFGICKIQDSPNPDHQNAGYCSK